METKVLKEVIKGLLFALLIAVMTYTIFGIYAWKTGHPIW